MLGGSILVLKWFELWSYK